MNVAEIPNQAAMMLSHGIFVPKTGRRALVDHVFIEMLDDRRIDLIHTIIHARISTAHSRDFAFALTS